jgi:hypothetical protein
MKKEIKERIIAQLVISLKESKLTKLFYNRNQIDLSKSKIKKALDLIDKLPVIKLDDLFIVPLGRLINLYSTDFDSDLNCFYFLVIKGNLCNLYRSDLKRIKQLKDVVGHSPLSERDKNQKLIYLLSCLQKHPDFIFEDIEDIEDINKFLIE